MVMFGRASMPVLLLILNFFSSVHSSFVHSPSSINISHFLYPKVTSLAESRTSPPTKFLQSVLDVIVTKEKWALEDIRISEVDVNKAKFRIVQRYEFRVPYGKNMIVVKMHDVVSEWKKLETLGENITSNLEDMSTEIGSKTAIDSFTVDGPFELMATGSDDILTLILPMNKTYSALRKISVSEGITVVVKGADAISSFYPSDHHDIPFSFLHSVCKNMHLIHIHGSASVVAYRTTRPTTLIRTVLSSRDAPAIRLLPDKCYFQPSYGKMKHLHSSFSSRIALLKQVLTSLLEESSNSTDSMSYPIRTSTRASTIFRFRLELERDIRKNDAYWSTFAEWRTKPAIERAWFEVVARIEDGNLKPVFVKRVRPLIDPDYSYGWSSLLSNVSFTKFPSLLVAPEALTLDVKW